MIVTVPPVYSAKRAIRHSYARTIGNAGSILCDILSHANDHHYHLKENDIIRHNLITCRSKLNKVKLRNFGGGRHLTQLPLQLGARHINATREYSLKGQWPEERYKVSRYFQAIRHILTYVVVSARHFSILCRTFSLFCPNLITSSHSLNGHGAKRCWTELAYPIPLSLVT